MGVLVEEHTRVFLHLTFAPQIIPRPTVVLRLTVTPHLTVVPRQTVVPLLQMPRQSQPKCSYTSAGSLCSVDFILLLQHKNGKECIWDLSSFIYYIIKDVLHFSRNCTTNSHNPSYLRTDL